MQLADACTHIQYTLIHSHAVSFIRFSSDHLFDAGWHVYFQVERGHTPDSFMCAHQSKCKARRWISREKRIERFADKKDIFQWNRTSFDFRRNERFEFSCLASRFNTSRSKLSWLDLHQFNPTITLYSTPLPRPTTPFIQSFLFSCRTVFMVHFAVHFAVHFRVHFTVHSRHDTRYLGLKIRDYTTRDARHSTHDTRHSTLNTQDESWP